MARVWGVWTKGPKADGDMGFTASLLVWREPCGTHPSLPKGWWREEAGEDTGFGTQQMHFVTHPRGVCVCWGKGCLGVWVHLLPLPASAGSLCTHRTQGHSPAARWTFTLLCKQAGARLGYQLEFHPVNGTRRLAGRAVEHLPSSLAPCLLIGTQHSGESGTYNVTSSPRILLPFKLPPCR